MSEKALTTLATGDAGPGRVVVGLGSNLGDRLGNLREAAHRISVPIEAASHLYETAPVGPPQPHYLNAAVLVRWPGDLPSLLAHLLSVEASLGRIRHERWAARTIDLDILWSDAAAIDLPNLTVPHPRLRERPFALLPLLDVAPDAPFLVPPFEPEEIKRLSTVWL